MVIVQTVMASSVAAAEIVAESKKAKLEKYGKLALGADTSSATR